jgi:arylsulfatase A
MTRNARRFLLLSVVASQAWSGAPTAAEALRPNILLILTDDQGPGTLGCYGSQRVATPHLDRLAAEGIRFTDAYALPQCTPTRAALLSGQHTARNGMWHVIPWYGLPWARVTEPPFRERFPSEWPSLPKTLQGAGYKTGMAGKWHLTTNADGDYAALKPQAAAAYGFDVVAPRGPGTQNEGDKWVDHLTDATIDFIRRHRDEPWFFYLAHHTLHGVVSAPPELVQKHRAAGVPPSGLHNATYLAAIEHLDNSVGRLLEALDELGLKENTLVVFLSDNGGVATSYEWRGASGVTPAAVSLQVREQVFDNAPLRAGKGSPYEGGLRVPCLVRWPAVIPGGQVSRTPIHVVDWMPTLLAAAGVEPPPDWSLDGVSLVSLFRGEALPDRSLYWYLPLYDLRWGATPCAVIRNGDWKLIEFFGDRFDADARYHAGHHLELFHLGDDPGEIRNLAADHPDRTEQLRSRLREWMRSIPVPIPEGNPRFDAGRMLDETRNRPDWLTPYIP